MTGGGTANVTINTGTVKGVNAFNSFSQFNVNGGQTVNLNLPTGTANLLNLVRDGVSNIGGIVNAYKDGRIGGNVFFFNPHGFRGGRGWADERGQPADGDTDFGLHGRADRQGWRHR